MSNTPTVLRPLFGLRVFEYPTPYTYTVSTAIDSAWGQENSPLSGSREAPGKSVTAPMRSLESVARRSDESRGTSRTEQVLVGFVSFCLDQYYGPQEGLID